MLTTIILATIVGSLFSLAGGVLLLLLRGRTALRVDHLLTAFAAGALLATAFTDLLPEAIHEGGGEEIFLWTLGGILLFFLLERSIHWFHHHGNDEPADAHQSAVVPLIVIGDTFHNFIDGIAIAASFLVGGPAVGILTTAAVAIHEIPQELGDFAVLLERGMSKGKVFLINLLSASASIVGAVLTFLVGDVLEGTLPVLLALTAGLFLYIALADLIPDMHRRGHNKRLAWVESLFLVGGVGAVMLLVSLLHHE